MLQGVCIDAGATTVLEKGKTYFLFSNGKDHYYVSRFPKAGAHFGCFRKSLFQIVQEDEWPPEPSADNVPVAEKNKTNEAVLETKAPECETKEETPKNFEQMSIFDFVE